MLLIQHLIAKSLSEACSRILESETWAPVVHIIHSLGVHSMHVPGLQAGPVERTKALNEIDRQLSELKGNLVITLADVWIGEDTPDGCVAVSWDVPFSGRRKALVAEVLECSGRRTCCMLNYKRRADGQVLFGELLWGDPSTSSGL
jgi:hypothetical protein